MADIVVKIKTNDGYDKIETFSADKPVNNVSTPTNEETTPNDGVNGKSMALGYVTLLDGYIGGQDTFLISEMNKYNGYMFGATDAEGNYDVGIEIFGVTFDKINIVGDKNANQFPTMAVLDEGTEDEKTVYNDDLEFGIAFAKESDSHTVRFLKWNRANYNACFTTMTVFVESLEYNRAYIEELSTSSESNFDTTTINYGVVSNSGDLKLLDIDGEIADYIRDGIIDNSNVPIEIIFNGKTIQHHITNNSSYNDRERVLSLTLTNRATLLDDTMFSGMPLSDTRKTLYDILVIIMKTVYTDEEIKKSMDSPCVFYKNGDNVVVPISNMLQSISIQYPYLKQSTVRQAIEKVCNLARINFYLDDDNKPKFVSARPIAAKSEIDRAIKLPEYIQIDELNKDLFVKNKYDGVSTSITRVKDEIDSSGTFGAREFTVYPWFSLMDSSKTSVQKKTTAYSEVVLARIEPYYVNGSYTISKKSDDNLKQLLDGTDKKVGYTLGILIKEGNLKLDTKTVMGGYGDIGDTSKAYPDRDIVYKETTSTSGKIKTTSVYAGVSGTGVSASFEDVSYINLIDNGDTVSIEYLILAGVKTFSFGGSFYSSDITGNVVSYMADKLSININGSVRTIEFNEEDFSTNNIENAKTIAMLNCSELQQSEDVLNRIKTDIMKDYSSGIMSANISTFCEDIYTEDDRKVISFENGETIRPNDIVFFETDKNLDGSYRFWRVISSTINSSGISNTLNLLEIKGIYDGKVRTITFPDIVDVYNGDIKLESGDKVADGAELRIFFNGEEKDLISISVGENTVSYNNYLYKIYNDSNIIVRHFYYHINEPTFKYPTSTSGYTDVVFDANYEELVYDLEITLFKSSDGSGQAWYISKDTINNYTSTEISQELQINGSKLCKVTIITDIGVRRILRISEMNSSYLGSEGMIYCETRYIKTSSGL